MRSRSLTNNESVAVLMEVKCLCEGVKFTDSVLNSVLTEDRTEE